MIDITELRADIASITAAKVIIYPDTDGTLDVTLKRTNEEKGLEVVDMLEDEGYEVLDCFYQEENNSYRIIIEK